MGPRTAVAVLCFCLVAVGAAQNIVLFGDSLSDNGNGYAGNAKFVLRTNQASQPLLAIPPQGVDLEDFPVHHHAPRGCVLGADLTSLKAFCMRCKTQLPW